MATDGHGALQPSRSPNTKEHPLLPANTHFPQGIGAAFYDLDGTILDLTRVSERTVAALEAVHAAGCANVISTGRNLPIVPDAIRLPCIDYYITVNGGQILHTLRCHGLGAGCTPVEPASTCSPRGGPTSRSDSCPT